MSKRILLIDSDESFARHLQSALEGRGLQVQVATNSESGMALAKSEGPELIVVCVEAQPTNGYMLCTRLKKDEQLKLVPVVLTSANATPDSFEKHKKLKTRAEEYLIKPFEPAALLHRIGKLLRIDIPPAPPAESNDEEIISMEDEPLGLGDLVGEDEPVHLTDSEAAEAHAGHPPPAGDLEIDTVEVEEVLSEVSVDGAHDAAPQHDQQDAASDDDLDLLDAAFDALSPASRPPAPREQVRHAPEPIAEEQSTEPQPEESGLELATEHHEHQAHPDAEGQAALEARLRELEEQLAQKDAEIEAARKAPNAAAELRKLKEARSKADKENVRLKEELNEKEKELIELRDQQATLEHQAQTLQDDATKREIAARSLQQRAEALAAAAKKFERELGAAREELKSAAQLKARLAELEKGEASHQELQKSHAALQAEAQAHRAELDARDAEAAQHKEKAQRLEAELADTKALHENELSSTREQHLSDAEELRAQAETHKAAAQRLEQELESTRARHAEAAAAAEGELALARDAHEKAQFEAASARTAAEQSQREHAEAREANGKLQQQLSETDERAQKAQAGLAALQETAETAQAELQQAQATAEKLRAELAAAREEMEKTQLELAGAQEQVDQARAEAAAAAGEKHLLSDERDELQKKLEASQSAAARNEQRALQAYQRIKGDEKLREKTKKALQIALQLLDEVQSLPEEPAAESDIEVLEDEQLAQPSA